MRHFLGISGLRLGLIFFGILLLGVTSVLFIIPSKPAPPVLPVVSICRTLKPGVRRIGNQYGIQFDVATTNFSIHEGVEDAPPNAHGFSLRSCDGKSGLNISFGPLEIWESTISDPDITVLNHLYKRTIVDQTEQPIGEDYWGYLNSGEHWRRVWFFKGGILAKYGFVRKEDAEMFDRIIESACILP